MYALDEEDFMKTKTARQNKVLFAVLFAALAFDLAGRISGHGTMMSSSDLASTAEEECTTLIYNGLKQGGKNAGCVLNYDSVRSEARIRRATKTEQSFDLDERPLPTPVRPTLADCSKIEVKNGKNVDRKATDEAKNKCSADNRRLEQEYSEALIDVQQANRSRTEEIFVIEITSSSTKGEEGEVITVRDSVSAPRGSNAKDLARIVREKSEAQYKKVIAKQKEAEKAQKEKEKLEADIAKCIKDSDGKALSTSARMQCKADRIDSLEGKELAGEFGSLRSMLRQTLESGNAEDREAALAISESLAGNSSLTSSQRRTAHILHRSGFYSNQILSISEQLAKTPENSPSRMFHMQRLAGLQQRMAYEFNGLQQQETMRAMGTGKSDALDEVTFWQGSLMTSLSTAMTSPQSLMDSRGYFGRDRLSMDLDQYRRTQRGIPGDPLVNTQGQFDGLMTNGQRYVQNAINQIGASQAPNQMGLPRFTPGVGNGLPLPGGQVQPGIQQPTNLPAQQPFGTQNNGANPPFLNQQRPATRTSY